MNQRFFIAAFSFLNPQKGKVVQVGTTSELITAESKEEAEAIATRLAHERFSLNDNGRCFIQLKEWPRQALLDWLNGTDIALNSEPVSKSEWIM